MSRFTPHPDESFALHRRMGALLPSMVGALFLLLFGLTHEVWLDAIALAAGTVATLEGLFESRNYWDRGARDRRMHLFTGILGFAVATTSIALAL